MVTVALLLRTSFFFLINKLYSLRYVLKIHKTFSYDHYLCTDPAYFYMLLNDDIVDIEKTDGICSPTFVVFLYPSIFSFK